MLSKSTYIFLIFISVVIIITFSFKNSCVIEGNTNADSTNDSSETLVEKKIREIRDLMDDISSTFDGSDDNSGLLDDFDLITNLSSSTTAKTALCNDTSFTTAKINSMGSNITNTLTKLAQVYTGLGDVVSLHETDLAAKQAELDDIIAGYEAANDVTKELVDDETERLKQDQVGNSRLVRNTQYYAKRYADLVFLVKCIILFSIFMIILIYLSSMGMMFSFISEIGIPFIFAVGLFGIWMMYVDIQRRNHYNYDEYNWNFIPPKTDSSS